MMGMLEYIHETPAAVRYIVSRKDILLRDALHETKGREIHEIILCGSGTSYHAALSAACPMQEILGIRVDAVYPVPFADRCSIVDEHTLVIGISQAGQSASTVKAMQYAKEHGALVLALSAATNSPVFQQADAGIFLDIGEENVGPKTKGYFCSAVLLVLFACAYAEKCKAEDYVSRMLAETDGIDDIREAFETWYADHSAKLKPAKRVIVVGHSANLGAVCEGALKLLEGLRCSVVGYEMEEFMHGIYHSVDENTYVFALDMPGEHRERLHRLMRYLQKRKHTHVILITDVRTDDFDCFVWPFNNDPLFAFVQYIVPLQVSARRISLDQGTDCEKSADPDFHREMESYIY